MTIGVVGAGQLGRMLALAGVPLGLDFLFLDRSANTPAGQVAPTLVGEFTDRRLLRQLASRCDVLSFDWENISVDALRTAARGTGTRIAPPLRMLAVAQDRLSEKLTFTRLKIPTTRFAAVESWPALQRAVERIGLPGVLKTRRMGYDGKGQRVLRNAGELAAAWQQMGSAPLIYEEFVPFDYEVSAIGARSRSGEVAIYPLSRNRHHDGILRVTIAPWKHAALERQARSYLQRVFGGFNYVGVLAIEFFVRRGTLVANEMAPRVHNSGHWTIEGAVTSQFENHLRAIAGLPLGLPDARGHAGMINLIGSVPSSRQMLAEPGLHLHDYGKQARPGRKVGHVTLVAATARQRNTQISRLLRRFYPELGPFP